MELAVAAKNLPKVLRTTLEKTYTESKSILDDVGKDSVEIRQPKMYPADERCYYKPLDPPTELTRQPTTETGIIGGKGRAILAVPQLDKLPPGAPIFMLIDNFFGKKHPLGLEILSHGEEVVHTAVRGLRDKVGVLAIHVDLGGDVQPMDQLGVSDALKTVLRFVKRYKENGSPGSHPLHLNLSLGKYRNYEELGKLIQEPVNATNIEELAVQQKILQALKKDDPDDYEQIQLVNALIDEGVQVSHGAGNVERSIDDNTKQFILPSGVPDTGEINYFSFSKSTAIGETDAAGKIDADSCESPLVKTHAQGTFDIVSHQTAEGHYQTKLLGEKDTYIPQDCGLNHSYAEYIGQLPPQVTGNQGLSNLVQQFPPSSTSGLSKTIKTQPLKKEWYKLQESGAIFHITPEFRQLESNFTTLDRGPKPIPGYLGEYVVYDSHSHMWLSFKVDSNGKLVLASNTQKTNRLFDALSGTSIASPNYHRGLMKEELSLD